MASSLASAGAPPTPASLLSLQQHSVNHRGENAGQRERSCQRRCSPRLQRVVHSRRRVHAQPRPTGPHPLLHPPRRRAAVVRVLQPVDDGRAYEGVSICGRAGSCCRAETYSGGMRHSSRGVAAKFRWWLSMAGAKSSADATRLGWRSANTACQPYLVERYAAPWAYARRHTVWRDLCVFQYKSPPWVGAVCRCSCLLALSRLVASSVCVCSCLFPARFSTSSGMPRRKARAPLKSPLLRRNFGLCGIARRKAPASSRQAPTRSASSSFGKIHSRICVECCTAHLVSMHRGSILRVGYTDAFSHPTHPGGGRRHTFPLSETREALTTMAQREQVGRIILRPQEF